MDDDFKLIDRWGQMYNTEPKGQFKNGPGPEVLNFINAAITLRMEAMLRHMSLAELQTLRTGQQADIEQLAHDAHALHVAQADLAGPAARALVTHWEQFMMVVCGHKPALLRKLIVAYTAEPLLHGTTVFDTLTLEVIKRAMDAQGHPLANPLTVQKK